MAYVEIQDFRAGLDTRRDPVSGVPGSLVIATNAHVTKGGALESRKSFVSTYDLPAGDTFGLQEVGEDLYVFGSALAPAVPAGVTYQRLVHPFGRDMTALLWSEVFDGLAYAIAEYSDGSVHHFYDGILVTDWDAGRVVSDMASNDGIASHFATLINAADLGVTAVAAGAVVTITGASDGTAFTLAAATVNLDGGVNDQAAVVATTTPAIASIAETLATGSFDITGGTSSVGVNEVQSVKVDGIEVLDTDVDWTVSHSGTATNVAAQIASYASTPEYTATADGATVIVSAAAGSGATANGKVIAVTTAGDVTIGNIVNMAGGVTAAAGQAQVSTVTFSGTFEVGDTFTLTIDGKIVGATGNPTPKGRVAMTHGKKMYAIAESLLHFSGVDAPQRWTRGDADIPGAGFINMASQDAGSAALTALEVYQGNLAVFARRTIQIWFIQEDESTNQWLQSLKRTGTRSPGSVKSFGNNDVFYLDDSGVRSLRARDSSNAAAMSDVGSAIDPLIETDMAALTDAAIVAAVAEIEPKSNRYWLAMGSKIYVFSFFPGAKISAWSIYEPGFVISHFAVVGDRIYARSGDTIYLYGGPDNATYPAEDEAPITIRNPFLAVNKSATEKTLEGFDMAASGEWTVRVLIDPNDTTRATATIIATGTTYPNRRIPMRARSTHFAPELTCSKGGHVTLSSIVLHFEAGEDD